ncbi:MAG: hypothetical protein GY953_48530 [bacterium]|nr:hypothetical protein [bacterium]
MFEDAVVARLYRLTRRFSDRAAAPFRTRRVQTVLLVDSWEPRPFSGPVTIIADSVPRARIHPSTKMGWGGLVPADSDTFIVPDNHPDFWSEVATRFVAEKVAERLAS